MKSLEIAVHFSELEALHWPHKLLIFVNILMSLDDILAENWFSLSVSTFGIGVTIRTADFRHFISKMQRLDYLM